MPKHSATLPGYTAIGIHSNHRDMARFATDEDPGFISVVCELQRWAKDICCQQIKAGTGAPRAHGTNGVYESADFRISTPKTNDYGGITILGNVMQSNVVTGNQTIYNGLTFGG